MSALNAIHDALFGNPPTSTFPPSREGVLSAFAQVQNQIDGLALGNVELFKQTRVDLYGDLSPAENTPAIVWGDATLDYNGIYFKLGPSSGGSWLKSALTLPATLTAELLSLRDQAYISATSAHADALAAAQARSDAIAAASAAGITLFYDTYSIANGALAGIAANAVLCVFVDETKSNRRTVYRKESGVLVFKAYLDDQALRSDMLLTTSGNGAALMKWLRSGSLIARTIKDKLDRDLPITPFDFDCVGDGSTIEKTKLQAMATVVNALYVNASSGLGLTRAPTILWPECLGFVTDDTISINAGVNQIMRAPLLCSWGATTGKVGMDLIDSYGTDLNTPRDTRCELDVRRIASATWASAGEADIGVRLLRGYNIHLIVKRTDGFTIGTWAGNGYGHINIGDIRDNKIGVLVTPTSTPQNFTNQLLIDGRSINVASNAGQSRYGIELRSASPYGINTVIINDISFEMNKVGAGSADANCIHLNGGTAGISDVSGRNLRAETCSLELIKVTGSVANADFGFLHSEQEYTHPEARFVDVSAATKMGAGTVRAYRQASGRNAARWPFTVFDSGTLVTQAIQATGSVDIVEPYDIAINVGAAGPGVTQTFVNWGGTSGGFDTDGYFSQSNLYGVWIDLNDDRSLSVLWEKKPNDAAALLALCFDAAGAQISAANMIYSGNVNAALVTSGVYGGRYDIGATHPASLNCPYAVEQLVFDVTVKSVFLVVSGAHRSMRVLAQTSLPKRRRVKPQVDGQLVSQNIPSTMTNVTPTPGQVVRKYNATTGNPMGWQLDAAGPTWKPQPNLA